MSNKHVKRPSAAGGASEACDFRRTVIAQMGGESITLLVTTETMAAMATMTAMVGEDEADMEVVMAMVRTEVMVGMDLLLLLIPTLVKLPQPSRTCLLILLRKLHNMATHPHPAPDPREVVVIRRSTATPQHRMGTVVHVVAMVARGAVMMAEDEADMVSKEVTIAEAVDMALVATPAEEATREAEVAVDATSCEGKRPSQCTIRMMSARCRCNVYTSSRDAL